VLAVEHLAARGEALDDHGAEAIAGGEHRGGVAGGAAADDDDVVGRGHGAILRQAASGRG
jgi:hypothetical protein